MEFSEQSSSIVLLSVALMSVFLGIVFIIFGYQSGTYSLDLASLYLQAVGVIATTLFVAVYLLIIERELEEGRWEKESQLMEDMVRQVVQPAIEQAAFNKRILREGRVDWNSGQEWEELELLLDIEAEPVEVRRFERYYPEKYELLKHHDAVLKELDTHSSQVLIALRGRISGFLANIDHSADKQSIGEVSNLLALALMNDTRPPFEHVAFNIYTEHFDSLQKLPEDVEADFEEFEKLLEDYNDLCEAIEFELRRIRNDLRNEYHISLETIT